MNSRPRFSIIIPTRNRAETLSFTLQTCLDQRDFDNYEIVVNDNGDDDESGRLVARIQASDPRAKRRIKYSKRDTICSMSRNFEEAITRADGEYLIVVGDDDGVLPMALSEIDRLIERTGAAVVKWRNGLYTWPNMAMTDNADYLGICVLKQVQTLDGKTELARALKTLNYDHLPMLYIHSAVRRDVAETMRDGDGRLFRSRSPDVYSAMGLAYFCGQYLEVSVPFTLAGLSRASNGISTAFTGANAKPRIDFSQLNAADGIFLHGQVPNLEVFPVIDLADSFSWAKTYLFSGDNQFELPRKAVIEACIRRSDVQAAMVKEAILTACQDDPQLIRFAIDLMAEQTEVSPTLRLRPHNLGADGVNLHLEAKDFGVTTIKDAVDLTHKIVWRHSAPLRYEPDL